MTSQLIEISQKHSVGYNILDLKLIFEMDGYQSDDVTFYEVKYGRPS